MTFQQLEPAKLAGRCANGYERGKGSVIHAVPHSDMLVKNGWCLDSAICGAKPGPRSAGWSHRADQPITCPKCLRKLAA